MPDDITMPTIAIAGGCLLLAVILAIFWFGARGLARRAKPDGRRTSFHAVVIDPRIAAVGRAAFEHIPQRTMAPPVVRQYITQPSGYVVPPAQIYLQRTPQPPHRMARGSTPAIVVTAAQPHAANHWDVLAPSVTARMRANRR